MASMGRDATSALARLKAAVETAANGDEALGRLLAGVRMEVAMVYLFMEYGAPGVVLTLPGTGIRAWKLTNFQVLNCTDEELRDRVKTWARSGSVPSPQLFWHR